MGKPLPLTLAGRHFRTRTEARAYCRTILHRWRRQVPITGPDHDFLLALFLSHPSAAAKAPTGISHFVVDRAPDKTGTAARVGDI